MEVGTLKELNVKPGDVVECVTSDGSFEEGDEYTISEIGGIIDDDGEDWMEKHECHPTASTFRIVSRASDTPRPFGELSDAEKGALLLAAHEGKVIEGKVNDGWVVCHAPSWNRVATYRIKPAPVREAVTLLGGEYGDCGFIFERDPHDYKGWYTGRITFDAINGKPDWSTLKGEDL